MRKYVVYYVVHAFILYYMTNLLCSVTHQTEIFPKTIYSSNLKEKYEYKFVKKLGEGNHGEVSLYRCINTNESVAIKMQLVADTKDSEEIQILKAINHPNIVKYIDSLVIDEYEYIIMEYVPYTLLDYLKINKFKFTDIKVILKQILDALKYLKEIKVIHIDIKSDNILLDENLNVKIIDFGISCTCDTKILKFCVDSDFNIAIKNFPQIAPEILFGEDFDNTADIYSFGYLCFFIYGKLVKAHNFYEEKDKISNNLLSNLIYISHRKPRLYRSSINDLIFHPFFYELYEFLECFCKFGSLKFNTKAWKIEKNDDQIYIKRDNAEYTLYCSCHTESKALYGNYELNNIEKPGLLTTPDYKTTYLNTHKFAVKKSSNILPIEFLTKEELFIIRTSLELIRRKTDGIPDNRKTPGENQFESGEDQISDTDDQSEPHNRFVLGLRSFIRRALEFCGGST